MLQPPQLAFPVRAANVLGAGLRRAGLLRGRLDPDRLIRAARERTGLDDFGPGPFATELGMLAESLEREAALSLLGRVIARTQLLHGLTVQLQVQDWFKRHPEIARQKIERPVFIVGMPRTGTSILHEVMALDRQVRVPESWEVEQPCPPPESASYDADPRIRAMDKQLAGMDRLLPDARRMHRMGARLPQECVAITACAFIGMMWPTLYRVPSYTRWLHHQADCAPSYRFHRRFLQLLQWRHPRPRWVLKSPGHLWSLPALLAEYPDACLIQTHRDPLRIMASSTSLVMTLRALASDRVDPREIAREWADYLVHALNASRQARLAGIIPAGQVMDVQFRGFMADPVAAVRGVYERFGLPWPDDMPARIARYIADNPSDKHGAHVYRFEDCGLDAAAERERVRAYQQHFGVASE